MTNERDREITDLRERMLVREKDHLAVLERLNDIESQGNHVDRRVSWLERRIAPRTLLGVLPFLDALRKR